jgi:hypothetical protein
MLETRKSKRFKALGFKRSLYVADYDYLSMEADYTGSGKIRQANDE